MARRFLLVFFAVFLSLTGLFVGTILFFDPFYHYHAPIAGLPLRLEYGQYQNPGVACQMAYDTLLLGTSVTANFSTTHLDERFGGTSKKLIVLGGTFSELTPALELGLKTHEVGQVFWGVDSNRFRPFEEPPREALPLYLYNQNPFDDLPYLLNKDVLFWDVTDLLEMAWTNDPGDAESGGYRLNQDTDWSKETALSNYTRPESVKPDVEKEAFLSVTQESLSVLLAEVDAHPETTFTFFLPPYSILFWDQTIRNGELDATLEMHRVVLETLSSRPNATVFYFMDALDIITNLDYYGDYIHYSPEICDRLMDGLKGELAESPPITPAEIAPRLKDFRAALEAYPFDAIWEEN